MEGRVLNADEARALADLESRDVMLSKIAGMIKSDISRAAAMFVAAQSRFLSLLEAYKEKFPAEASPEVEATPAQETPIEQTPIEQTAASEPETEPSAAEADEPAEAAMPEESQSEEQEQSPPESAEESQE
jgi:large subunit ribosomal protein L10